jgi:hypothetical protein
MKPKSPSDRRECTDASRQIGRIYDKLVYWLYQRHDERRAQPYADRLRLWLADCGSEVGSIFVEDCWSLIHQAKGDLAKAIKHRENEIRLMRRLHELAQNTAGANFVFRQYSYADLRDELDLLAILYHDSGDLDKAISVLQKSKNLCQKHGIRFDGEDILREYLKERHVTTDVELRIEASNGSVSAETLPQGTLKPEAGSASKTANPRETQEGVRRSAGRYGEEYKVSVSPAGPPVPALGPATGLPCGP